MKKLLIVIVLLTVSISFHDNSVYYEDAYIIENISIIDPNDGLKKNKTVVIKSNKIHEIFDSTKKELSKKNIIYSGKDKFLIPGFWDAHVHFAFDESPVLETVLMGNQTLYKILQEKNYKIDIEILSEKETYKGNLHFVFYYPFFYYWRGC